MEHDARLRHALVLALAKTIDEHAEELTALDQAIGDGDHGLNMKRGFEAVSADIAVLAQKAWPEFLKAVGMTLVMKVGGASGPLFGTLFMTLGKELPIDPKSEDVVRGLRAAIVAVQARGKAEPGHKTLIDVFIPVVELMEAGHCDLDGVAQKAHEASQATKPLKAIRGRASFLGDRSIGHMDPGARSSALLIAAAVDVLKEVA